MTSGPTYGQGFVELEPRLSRDFLTKINNQLDRAFSNVKLNVDDSSLRAVQGQLQLIEGSADRAASEVAAIARESGEADTHLRDVASHMGISEDAARRMATEIAQSQTEARQLEGATVRVQRELADTAGEAREMAQALEQAGRSQASVGRLSGAVGALRTQLGNAALAAVAFFGVRGIMNQAEKARDAFIALGESVNAVEVVFGDASDTIFTFSDQVAQSAGLAKSEFQQMSTVLGAALQNAGLGADEAAQKTITLTQRAADLASVFNTDVADALGAIQAALRGEGDPIERFGVSLSAAAVDAEAAALGYSRVAGEFDNTAKAAARISLIMEQTNRVAGDFANTSDSLANKQRIAAAEMENVRAELGEALLPIFEKLVEVGPAVVEGLKDLIPSLTSLATSAAGLVESTPGVIDFMDALHLLTDLPRGFGQLFDGVKVALGTLVAGSTLADEALQNMLERRNTQGLIDDLREGGDAATVLANRLADVGKKGKLTPEFIRNLREIAGTDLAESVSVLGAMVENVDRLGLSAEEIAMLNVEFARLRNELLPVGNEIAQAARAMLDIPEVVTPAVVTALDSVRIAASEAELSMGDLVAGINPVAAALLDTLTPAERLALKMEVLAAGAATAAEAFTSTLQPSLIDVQEGLKDLNEDGQISLQEFTTSLETAATDFLNFMVDIAAIAAISPELAKALKDLGPDTAGFIADGFAKADEGAILAAAENLLGSPEQIAETFQGIYQSGLESVDGSDPAAIEAWLGFISDTFEADLPGITAIMAEAFQPSLDAAIEGLDPPDLNPVLAVAIAEIRIAEGQAAFQRVFDFITGALNIDLTDEGISSGRTYIGGILEAIESSQAEADVKKAVTNTLHGAIQMDSPPKLFLDAGVASGEAFWQGFTDVDALTVVIPPIDIPEVVIPPIQVPEVVIPEIEIPPIEVPEVEIPDIEIPDIVMPEVVLPEIEIPEVVIPPIEIPDVEIPDVLLPDIVLSDVVVVPEVVISDIVLPEISVPDVILPEIILSDVILPELAFPDVVLPDIVIPDVVLPEIILSDVVLPELVIPDVVLPEISVPNIDLPTFDLTDIGTEAGDTLIAGVTSATSTGATDLRAAILQTLDKALDRNSPPKLFLEAGRDSGDAFWAGFAGVAMDFPGIDLSKSFTAARAATFDVTETVGTGGPLIGSMQVYNPIGEPTEESVQSALIEVAISPMVRNAGAGSSF